MNLPRVQNWVPRQFSSKSNFLQVRYGVIQNKKSKGGFDRRRYWSITNSGNFQMGGAGIQKGVVIIEREAENMERGQSKRDDIKIYINILYLEVE